jgi:hypothetical protein
MGFITQSCERFPDWQRQLVVFLMLFLVGCAQEQADFGFNIEAIESRVSSVGIKVLVEQKLILSQEAQDALRHGVPLDIQTRVALRKKGSGRDVSSASRGFQIRYLPLSKHYQLTASRPHEVITRPRLRHILAKLSAIELTVPGGPWHDSMDIRVRSELDSSHLPSPMRLPTLFSPQWKHDSGWQSWPAEPSTPSSMPDLGVSD